MNIQEAKEEIKNAVKAYYTKDEYGNYIIPIESQRPIFMIGAPGIGKTAIMQQVASELNIGLLSYSMTHHTRQSALGLPFIEKKLFGGKEYNVSEYTMSEIIAAVYNTIECTGYKEGILFLDEINCVSETLAPAMLQFLQYKIFGTNKIPDGWIIVTAGNPPEYNNSVKEFDIATLDRVKRIDVEPDYLVWKEYAYKTGIHSAIISYLDLKQNYFYSIETTVDGKSFVTARGWSDLSNMIKLYELNGVSVTRRLVSQYIQDKTISKDFSIYYDLYKKYSEDYQIDKILNGTEPEEIIDRAQKALFDERVALIGLVMDAISSKTKDLVLYENTLMAFMKQTQFIEMYLSKEGANDIFKIFNSCMSVIKERIKNEKKANSLSKENEIVYRKTVTLLEDLLVKINLQKEINIKECIKKYLKVQQTKLEKNVVDMRNKITNSLKFFEKCFSEGQEMIIFITELTLNYYTVFFLSNYGCPEYSKHNKNLMFTERQKELKKEISELEL